MTNNLVVKFSLMAAQSAYDWYIYGKGSIEIKKYCQTKILT